MTVSPAAESLGMGTVFVGAIRDRPLEVAAELGLPQSWVQRVAGRFGSIDGLKGREHLREALRTQGFELG
ncbi:hypothetical protein [Kribbella amoyensis]|uniref:hypothetical protein n=1 Tax=Kribbella amoyensis TaxID=996641 RepID=UPI00192D2206|nr:hypothetical protein [Kribbella amoyensis]